MSKRDYKLFLEDIVEEIDRLYRFTKNIKFAEDLANNDLVLYAVLKCFENIGEAVKHIPENIKEKYPYQWKKIAGLRDIISHEYWGVDCEIILNIIYEKLPELKEIVNNILKQEYYKWKFYPLTSGEILPILKSFTQLPFTLHFL